MMTLLLNFIPGAALHDDSNELSSGGSFLLFVSGDQCVALLSCN